MQVNIDKSIIGKTVCYLERSVVSDKINCHSHKATAYMVEKSSDGVYAKVRLDNGRWIRASYLFLPEEEAAERVRFAERLKQN